MAALAARLLGVLLFSPVAGPPFFMAVDNPLEDTEMVEDFVAEANERLDRLGDLALQAEAGEADAWGELRREIHTLKGAAGFLGLDQFSDLCHEFEEFVLGVLRTGNPPEAGSFDLLMEGCELLRDLVNVIHRCALEGGFLVADPRVRQLQRRFKDAS